MCTANICRSPLAAAILGQSAAAGGMSEIRAASAGFLEGGRPVHEHVSTILSERGIDASRKRSQKLTDQVVGPADLILTMTSEHARGVVGRFPHSIGKVYTLRHFATVVTPRPADTQTSEWLDDVNRANKRAYLGDDDSRDISDPIGHPMPVFRTLADELTSSIDWIVSSAFYTGVAENDSSDAPL